MTLKVSEIFAQKLNEIQGRVPIRIKGWQQGIDFQQVLDTAVGEIPPEKNIADSVTSFERAKSLRDASTASIPVDKRALIKLINSSIQSASEKYGVDEALIRAVIKQESDYNPYSLSHAGAQGLMQLMPDTADALGLEDPWDIDLNIDGGTRYLRDQLAAFGGDLRLALAAYNAGPNNVKKYKGIPPFAETQNYVEKVLRYYSQYK